MSDTYHKVGTSYRTAFAYVLPTGAVTGLAQASFTIELSKNGTGGQATTGITLTQVSSSTNAGEYAIVISGTTGCVSAVGVYDLVIYRTTTPADRWLETIRVTVDGTGEGSFGTVSFTATASNGRIMASGVPLSGATVRINSPVGNLFAQLTSNASGLWGPVWFVDDGTYTVYAQKSGYTVTSGTIVVTGTATVATGPGADLSISAASSASGLTASLLWAHFKRALRDRNGSQADTLAMQGVDDALTMIAQEAEWPWYHTVQPITLQPYYATGTLALVLADATVTLTGGTWPSWAASGELYLDGQWYSIASRTSDTVIELDFAWGEASDSAHTFVIAQTSYDLPSDLMSIDGLRYDRTWAFSPTPISMANLLLYRSGGQWSLNRPTLWSTQRNNLVVWPMPDVKRSVNLMYYRKPAALANGSDEADWDPTHLTLLRRAIEYQAALRGECVVGDAPTCHAAYQIALARASQFDKAPADHDETAVTGALAATDQWWRGSIES